MEAAVLNLLPTQPADAPAQHEALIALAKYRADLEKTPSNKRGDWHEAAETAFQGIIAIQGMVSRLLDLRADLTGSTANDALDYAIDQLVEAAGVMTADAERRAEEDAPAYNSEDYWPRYRG
jgi:hypothetical protein